MWHEWSLLEENIVCKLTNGSNNNNNNNYSSLDLSGLFTQLQWSLVRKQRSSESLKPFNKMVLNLENSKWEEMMCRKEEKIPHFNRSFNFACNDASNAYSPLFGEYFFRIHRCIPSEDGRFSVNYASRETFSVVYNSFTLARFNDAMVFLVQMRILNFEFLTQPNDRTIERVLDGSDWLRFTKLISI